MPVNPLIALSGTQPNQDVGRGLINAIATRKQLDRQAEIDTRNAETQGKQNELLDLQIDEGRTRRVLKNIAPKLMQAKQLADSGNQDGLIAFLKQNRLELGEQIAQGADVDTIDTDEAIAQIEGGDIEGFKGNIDFLLGVARNEGLIPESEPVIEVLDATQAKEQLGIELKPGTVVQRTSKDGNTTGIEVLQKSDVLSDEAQGQKIEQVEASAKARAEVEQNSPAAQLARQLTQERINTLQTDRADKEKKIKQEEEKRELRAEAKEIKANIVEGKVDEAITLVDKWFTTGFLGNILKDVGGTDARSLATAIDTIRANLGFAELQAMREASPTGGALGQVAVQEINFLQSTIASLDIGLEDDVLKENLNQVKTSIQNWKNAVDQAARESVSSNPENQGVASNENNNPVVEVDF